MGLCVRSWMGRQVGDLISGIFEAAPECQEDLSLSILARRPYKDLCPLKTCKTGSESEGR